MLGILSNEEQGAYTLNKAGGLQALNKLRVEEKDYSDMAEQLVDRILTLPAKVIVHLKICKRVLDEIKIISLESRIKIQLILFFIYYLLYR